MGVELKPWDSAELLRTEQDLALYLGVVLEEEEDDGPTIYAASLRIAARARGGVEHLARESDIPQQELEDAMKASEEAALPVVQRLSLAYANMTTGRLVA